MKRQRLSKAPAVPGMIKWSSRAPGSCNSCRSKKLRCDPTRPCSNCTLRNVTCVSGSNGGLSEREELMTRIRKLEVTVFARKQDMDSTISSGPAQAVVMDLKLTPGIPFGFQTGSLLPGSHPRSVFAAPTSSIGTDLSASEAQLLPSRHLPPYSQAVDLFNHFVWSVQTTLCVLHIPSTRLLMFNIYQAVARSEEPPSADLAVLFAIFTGSALTWTPQLLDQMQVSPSGARLAFKKYSDLSMSLLDESTSAKPSTTALSAMVILIHLFVNMDGPLDRVEVLRARALGMARAMNMHRLDAPKSRADRIVNGYDKIDLEVQRRIWWWLVASDWLVAFAGGPQEGTYTYQVKQMHVEYPCNLDDDAITASGDHCDLPLSTATHMTAALVRIQLAQLCREVVDSLLLAVDTPKDEAYHAQVLVLDAKFDDFVRKLPAFLQLDHASDHQSEAICRERVYVSWQRTLLHFSINIRLCRLHRPFQIEGATNPKYASSRRTCIQAAQKVLKLRRCMDHTGPLIGLRPSLFWSITQYTFLAATILAADIPLEPSSPQNKSNKAEVLAACRLLEQSQRDSFSGAREGIQRRLQTLLQSVNRQNCPELSQATKPFEAHRHSVTGSIDMIESSLSFTADQPSVGTVTASIDPRLEASDTTQDIQWRNETLGSGGDLMGQAPLEDWDQLWSGFFESAHQMDVPQWNTFMDEVDYTIGPVFS